MNKYQSDHLRIGKSYWIVKKRLDTLQDGIQESFIFELWSGSTTSYQHFEAFEFQKVYDKSEGKRAD